VIVGLNGRDCSATPPGKRATPNGTQIGERPHHAPGRPTVTVCRVAAAANPQSGTDWSWSTGSEPLSMAMCTAAVTTGGSLPTEEVLHFSDLALLSIDNSLGELTGVRVLSVLQLSLVHRHSP
jgi:hypothetical protein